MQPKLIPEQISILPKKKETNEIRKKIYEMKEDSKKI
jgi:hypothetical protein